MYGKGLPCSLAALEPLTSDAPELILTRLFAKNDGKCAKACPYNAIADLILSCKRSCPVNAMTMDEYGVCQIDESKALSVGSVSTAARLAAISSKAFLVDVVKDLVAGKRVVAMIAPSAEGQFGEGITVTSWRKALQQVGFADLVEVALGQI